MGKIGVQLKGFFLVSLGLVIMVLSSYAIMCCYRGHELYYGEIKEFKGALSRTMGGDYKARADFVEPEPAELSPKQVVKNLSDEQKEEFASALIEDGFSVPRNIR